MKSRTIALALALSLGLTGLAEAKKKGSYHATPRKTHKYKPFKAKKFKASKFRSKTRKTQ